MKPIHDNAVAEARWIVVAWCLCAVWVLGGSYLLPPTTPDSPRIFLGMPMWIAVGVVLPWALATIFTIWFSLAVMSDDAPPETESRDD